MYCLYSDLIFIFNILNTHLCSQCSAHDEPPLKTGEYLGVGRKLGPPPREIQYRDAEGNSLFAAQSKVDNVPVSCSGVRRGE